MDSNQIIMNGLGLLCLPGVSADLRDEEIDTEWSVLVLQEALQLGNLFSEHVRGVADAANDAQTASVRDSGSKLGAGCHVHAGKHDGMVDFEEVSDRRAKLFYS